MTEADPGTLIDAGVLVAWLNRADRNHEKVRTAIENVHGELVTSWPVLTEACHLIPRSLTPRLLQWASLGGARVADLPPKSVESISNRMQHLDLPPDLADASLIWIAESEGIQNILTLDRPGRGVLSGPRGQLLRSLLSLQDRQKT